MRLRNRWHAGCMVTLHPWLHPWRPGWRDLATPEAHDRRTAPRMASVRLPCAQLGARRRGRPRHRPTCRNCQRMPLGFAELTGAYTVSVEEAHALPASAVTR